MSSKICLILAAGRGVRMNSQRAKVLHEVAGRPLIFWLVEAALTAKTDRIIVVLGHQHEQVKEALSTRYEQEAVETVLQREQNGTGHAVTIALESLTGVADDAIVTILSGDAPLLPAERIAELIAACEGSKAKLALLSTTADKTIPYGRLLRGEDGGLEKIVEDRDCSEAQKAIKELNAGFYAAQLGVLRRGLSGLRNDNAQGELYLTDLIEVAAHSGGASVIAAKFKEVHGVNDRIDLAAVNGLAYEQTAEHWLRAGVTLQHPPSTFIDADVGPIGRDTVIAAGVQLRGATTIGEGVHIGVGSVLTDVTIANFAELKPYCVATDTQLGDASRLGPFAHCRPGTRLDARAKVGNFVETKKAHLMEGAKASHLSYLGDAAVGANANIGAGTITCNYDGFKKYKTTIEGGAFIGSDTQLVAPVTIGRDAYVGSGTTVTKDVPRSALALSRTKQVNIDDWANRFREAQNKRKRRSDSDL